MKKYARIKDEYVINDVKWLIIEKDTLGSGGYFLFYQQTLNEACIKDYWFIELKYALEFAKEDFDVNEDDWIDF